MSYDNVIELQKTTTFIADPITEILRQGARKLLAQALETDIDIFINQYKDLKDELDRQRIVRNGHLPERDIQSQAVNKPHLHRQFGPWHDAPQK